MRIYYINSDTEGSPACFDTVFPVKIFRRLSYNFETSLEHIKMKKITAFLLMLTLFTIPLLAQKASQFKGVAQLQSPQGPPPMAAQPDVGFRTAGWYWSSRDLNRFADSGDFRELTRRINGGYNGMADREQYHAAAKKALGI